MIGVEVEARQLRSGQLRSGQLRDDAGPTNPLVRVGRLEKLKASQSTPALSPKSNGLVSYKVNSI